MKKIVITILTIFILLSCVKDKPNNNETVTRYFVITKEKYASKIDQVSANKDYVFTVPKDKSYNKVFVNNKEMMPTLDGKYVIKNIQEDKLITFNNQYKILLSKGSGYSLEMISDHLLPINAGETVKFKLIIDSEYDESEPIVLVNDKEVEVIKGEFVVESIKENVSIKIENVEKNQIVVIPEEPEIPKDSDLPDKPDYSFYSNNDLSWWYRYPSPLYSDVKPTIDSDIKNLISKYNGIWMLDRTDKVIVLTMDEGYEFENNTTNILDIAAAKDVPITFFVTGGYIDANPQLVLRMVNEGHVVANHSDKHLRASPALNISDATLIDDTVTLEAKFKALTDTDIAKLYRPPEGGYSERSLAITKDLGYKTIFWSFAYRDWITTEQPNHQEALDKIISQVHPGAILLLHAVSNTNVAILGDLIDEVRAMGYTFITIPN